MGTSTPPTTSQAASEVRRICRTFESLVIAFILAFVFRAFCIEAFVIPTGSMATTLYGQHWTFLCSNCGYEYAAGPPLYAQRPRRIVCPNCHWELDPFKKPEFSPRSEGGDRILVFKFPYDLASTFLGPKRWDVAVFKNPGDGDTNYIKRLVGLPEEVLEIIDGDIYVAPAEKVDADILDVLSQPPPNRPVLAPDQRQRLDAVLTIQPKAPAAQEALWMTLYDQDYPQTQEAARRFRKPFRPRRGDETAWQLEPREFKFDGLDQPVDELAFAFKRVDDFYAYNTDYHDRHAVSDVRLSAVVTPQAQCGWLQMEVTRQTHHFRLTLHADGRAEMLHSQSQPDGKRVEIRREACDVPPWQPGQAAQVALSNVDHVARFELDGRTLLTIPWPTTTAEPRNVGAQRWPEILIAAADTRLTVRHVRLERDVYYVSSPIRQLHDRGYVNRDLVDAPGWGTSGRPVYLRQGEYFAMGDNSPGSLDSRLWWHACELLEPAGPLRQLLERHQDQAADAQPLDESQVEQLRAMTAELQVTLGRVPDSRHAELTDEFRSLTDFVEQEYIPALVGRSSRTRQMLSELAERLDRIDWASYRLGTVPQDQLMGKAFFVYWPAGLSFLDTGWGIIPNFGRMRLVR